MAKLATVGGITGVGFLALGIGLPKIIEGLSPVVSYGVAAFGGILLVTAYIWSLLSKGGEDGAKTTQTSHGQHSPNYARVEGGVHNYFVPPPAPVPTPAASPWDDPDFSLTNAAKWDADLTGAVPDMELREVCERLYNHLGGPTQLIADFEKRVDLKIKDGVRHQGLHTWGRRNPDDGLDDVWKTAWLRGDFSHKRGTLNYRDPDNQRHQLEWTDLHFNRREVDRWLPRKPEFEILVI